MQWQRFWFSSPTAQQSFCEFDLLGSMHQDEQPVRRRYIGKQPPRHSEVVLAYQPLAAEPHRPKEKRRQTKSNAVTRVRVQFAGQRLSCSKAFCRALKARLQQERESRTHWTTKQWEFVVKKVALEGWGACQHGGSRNRAHR